MTGILAYAVGARHGIAVPAVVGSQFAGLAALGGYGCSASGSAGHRWSAAGVAVLAALQASA